MQIQTLNDTRAWVPRRISKYFRSAWFIRTLTAVVFIGLWQIVSGFYPPFLLPGPTRTFSALITLILEGKLLIAFTFSMQALLIAFALALAAGVVLGLLMGNSARIETFMSPFMDALYVTPKVMLIPLFIIWFGIGIEARIAYIFIVSYFPIVVNTMVGVHQVRGTLTETARAFGANRRDMFLKVYLPGSVPLIMAGIRLGLGHAIVGMITAEMFLALVGLGYMVADYGNRLATDKVLAMVLVVSSFGILATQGVRWAEKWLAPWASDVGTRPV